MAVARAEIFEQVTSTRGVPIAGIAVTVRKRSDNTLATLYAAATGGTTVANPITSDAYGQINAWVDEGSYVLQATDATDIPFDAVNGDKRIAHAADHAAAGTDPLTLSESQVTNLVTDLAAKAPLASPTFTGDPKAPTATPGDNDTSLATTAFVTDAVTTEASARSSADALKAPLASPTFTGDPLAPTAAPGDNDTSIATTAFVTDAVSTEASARSTADALKAPLASPTFTGDPKAPTATPGDNDTSLATTAFVTDAVATEATARSTADALKAQALIPTAVKTANYTAAANDFVPADCTSGSLTVTLPSAPADRTRVGVKLIAVSGAFLVTVAAGGADVFNKAGGVTSFTMALTSQSVLLQYASASGIWYVQSTDVPISGLDARYPLLTLYDAKGDLLVATADNTAARKAVGSNYKVLHSDSAQSDGLAWDKISDMVKVGATLDRIYPSDLGEFFDRRRSSEVQTLPRLLAQSALTLVSGTVYGVLAYARSAQTFTQIRFATGGAPSALTDVRLGVYNAAGTTKLSETAESHGTVTAANTVYTLNLGTNIVAAEGDAFILVVGGIGTTMTARGVALGASGIGSVTPQLSFASTGWTTGNTLPATLPIVSAFLPWIELL